MTNRSFSSFRSVNLPKHLQEFDIAPGGCWIARRRRPNNGYAWATTAIVDGVRYKGSAYKIVWEILNGPTPEGMELEHVCCNGAGGCMNPNHLRPCTHLENMQRGGHRARTHCNQGHPLDGDNLLLYGPEKQWRGCRECRRETQRKHLAKVRRAECLQDGCDKPGKHHGWCWPHYETRPRQNRGGRPRFISDRVLETLKAYGPLTSREVANLLDLTPYQAGQALQRLRRHGQAQSDTEERKGLLWTAA